MSDLVARHREVFGGTAAVRVVRAPGRVNLIGEHTDYTDGWVLPMALDLSVRVAASPHSEPVIRLWSEPFAERAEFRIGEPLPTGAPDWLQYPMRVAEVLAEAGVQPAGFDGVIGSDLPMGAGLASSAALEVAMALAMLATASEAPRKPSSGATGGLSASAVRTTHWRTSRQWHPRDGHAPGCEVPPAKLAALCQEAEHRVGVRCGIMDQFACLHGRRGRAILLDCRSLEFEAVPLPSDRARVVVIDSGVRRKLTAAAYNERRAQCGEARGCLLKFNPDIKDLRDVSPEFLADHEQALPRVAARRCRHVVTENERVRASAAALKTGDLALFGRLMNESHNSLRDDYEVSGPELDRLVEIARSVPGVLGSRLTGAGFGGCTVSLVQPEAVEALRAEVFARYPGSTGLEPRVWVCDAADGASIEM
jgi:galactokinase